MCLTEDVFATEPESDEMCSVNVLFLSRLCVFKECLVCLFVMSQ